MVDFKKKLQDLYYRRMKDERLEVYTWIVGFSSTLDAPLRVKAEVEAFCMGLAWKQFNRGISDQMERERPD